MQFKDPRHPASPEARWAEAYAAREPRLPPPKLDISVLSSLLMSHRVATARRHRNEET